MLRITLIPKEEFDRIRASSIPKYEKLALLADMNRANTLATVKKAGSGHLGSSFSSLDIVTILYYDIMNITDLGISHPDRDIYFSSKGHDCPGHYSVLFSLGIIPKDIYINLRRLGGTHGHPDVSIPGIEANSGSLGMGISKAKGMALAKKMKGTGGHIYVMTGDGELQEGQIWEALQTTAHQRVTDITVIVDYNKIQTDKPVEHIVNLGALETKFQVFGWHVEECNGYDFEALENAFARIRQVNNKPKALIAHTIKGKGISFMEGPQALKDGNGIYRWHAGAPDDEAFEAGYSELISRIKNTLNKFNLPDLTLELIEERERHRVRLKDTAEKVVDAYSEALVELGYKRKDIIVIDADLASDCGVRLFEKTFPERFIENGIAEQDMVSTAGGLALQGFLPVVNSFGAFLASRANEQIYNNATEGTKIIYVCHYAGLIPAGPGKSHQSLRDISLFGALPNCIIIEPCNGIETKRVLEWCMYEARENCMIRLAISPSPRTIQLPKDYEFEFGKGTILREGKDAVLFAYGPVMLNEALIAAELLEDKGYTLRIVNMPWLNRIDNKWLENVIGDIERILVIDNHSAYGGLGDFLITTISGFDRFIRRKITKLGISTYPACGTPQEVLEYHHLNAMAIANLIP